MDVKTTFRNLVRDQSVSICMLQITMLTEYFSFFFSRISMIMSWFEYVQQNHKMLYKSTKIRTVADRRNFVAQCAG
jgi:hypothetical protein